MPWTQRHVDWVAARLLPDLLDIAERSSDRQFRITSRLHSLYHELTRPMKRIRLTEPVFWHGKQRQAGEEIDAEVVGGVVIGPTRTQGVPGGLTRIAQFVEMAEEIKITPADVGTIPPATLPPVQPMPQAPAAPVSQPIAPAAPPAAAKPAPKGNQLAARIRALTARQARFNGLAARIIEPGEQHMDKIETDGPAILQRMVDASHDNLTALEDLADALKQAGNGPF